MPVRINCRLQACVVRRRIVHAAAHITHKILTPPRQLEQPASRDRPDPDAAGSEPGQCLQGPAGPVLFQLPAFVGNIAHASAGTVDEKTGTVTLATTVRTVTVQLTHPES